MQTILGEINDRGTVRQMVSRAEGGRGIPEALKTRQLKKAEQFRKHWVAAPVAGQSASA